MISLKNGKSTLNLYAVLLNIDGDVDELPVLAHDVTVNHKSGILSFWKRTDDYGKFERMQSFAHETWTRYYKVKDYPNGYPEKA